MAVVIIPAYRPDEVLVNLADSLWRYGCRIIVVDDGSGREYRPVFEKISDISVVLRHRENQGKGAAIKTALRYIQQELPDCGVIGTMDADGQHRPEDMMKLLEAAEDDRNSLILGVRKVGREMPLKSRLGNQITRGIFHLESGVKVSDTQTGLRAFGTELLEELSSVKGERYEYEMNVLLTAAKTGISIKELPIKTIYRDRENSTSHFRAVRDSVRIYGNLLKFTLSSLSSFCLDYLLFMLLTSFLPGSTLHVLGANVIARILSAYYNYTINCRFVFHTEQQLRTAADYFALAGSILVMNNLILGFLFRGLHIPVYQAKLMTELILFLVSWLVQNKLIFRKKWKGAGA